MPFNAADNIAGAAHSLHVGAETLPVPRKSVILVVEDEEAVRRLVTRLLKAEGFDVLAVANGRLALPVWKERRDEIDLLLTDVIMPEGINGRELAETFQRDRAGLKVIYTSGYNLELAEKDGRLRPGTNFIQKPYRPEQLIQAIRKTLETSNGSKIEVCSKSCSSMITR